MDSPFQYIREAIGKFEIHVINRCPRWYLFNTHPDKLKANEFIPLSSISYIFANVLVQPFLKQFISKQQTY